MKRRRRARAAAARLASAAALSLTFAVATTGGAVLHAGLPAPRRAWLALVTRAFDASLAGTLVIERVGRIGAGGVDGLDAVVLAPDGAEAIRVRGARARLSVLGLARGLVRRDVTIAVDEVRASDVRVSLARDASGAVAVARAFARRAPSASKGGASIALRFATVEIDHAAVLQVPVAGSFADVDVDGARGAVHVADGHVGVRLARTSVRARAGAMEPHGVLEGDVVIPAPGGGPIAGWAGLDVLVGEVALSAHGSTDGRAMDLRASMPEVTGDAIRALAPGAPLAGRVSASCAISGALPRLDVAIDATVDAGALHLAGTLDAGATKAATLSARASDVDARSFVKDAPGTRLGGEGRAELRWSEGHVVGTFALDALPGDVDATPIPGGHVEGEIAAHEAHATFRLDEPGARVDGELRLLGDPADGAASRIEVDARGAIPALDRAPRLGGAAKGSARWTARAAIEHGKVAADVDVTSPSLARGAASATGVHARARIAGPLARPRVELTADAAAVRSGAVTLADVRARAGGDRDGGAVRLSTDAGALPALELAATISRGRAGATLRDAVLVARRGSLSVVARAPRATLDADGFLVPELVVEGSGGTLRGDLSARRGVVELGATVQGLDLGHLGAVLGVGHRMRGGRLDIDDLQARIGGASERLHAELRLEDAAAPFVERIGGRATIDLQGGLLTWRVQGDASEAWTAAVARAETELATAARGALGAIGTSLAEQLGARAEQRPIATLTSSGAATLAGPLLAPSSWVRATSTGAELDGALDLDAPMSCTGDGPSRRCTSPSDALAWLLPRTGSALHELGGKVVWAARLARPRGDGAPDVELSARTEGLHVGGPGTGEEEAWRSSGVDVRATAAASRHGDVSAVVTTLAIGAPDGDLATATASADLPLGEWIAHPERAARIVAMPLSADVRLTAGALDRLPAPVRPAGIVGVVGGEAHVRGTLRDPRISAHMDARRLALTEPGLDVPFDVDLDAELDAAHATAKLRADRSALARRPDDAAHEVAARATLDVPPGTPPSAWLAAPWRGTGALVVRGLPLEGAPRLAEAGVAGALDADVAIEAARGARPTIDARADLRALRVAGVAYDGATLRARGDADGATHLEARMTGGHASLAATADARLAWPSALAPSLDPAAPASLALETKALPASVLAPALRDVFATIDGAIDGKLTLRTTADGRPDVSGWLSLSNGVVQIPELGQELRGVTARAEAQPGGVLQLADVSATSGTGRISASARVQLEGLGFRSATGTLDVAEKSPIPLTLEGVSFGDAWGHVEATATREPGSPRIDADLTVPTLHVDLPDSSARVVQSLEPSSRVHALVRRADGTVLEAPLSLGWSPRAADALVLRIGLHLGDDVRIRRGAKVDLRVGAPPGTSGGPAPLVVELADRARVLGVVDVASGSIDVLGKRFEVDHGSVAFDGVDSGNPDVAVTVRWDAPDATRVLATYVGRLRDAKVTLSAEPARSQPEIMSLILFGTNEADNLGVSSGDGGAGNAASVGSALAADGLQRALGGSLPVSAKVDTSNATNPRPEVAVRISRDVSAQLAYSTNVPPPGQNPDRVLVTLDWTFRKRWSISTTLGDRGSSLLDLVWQYRY